MTTIKTVTAHIRMAPRQYDELRQEALEQGLSLSEYLRHIIGVYRTLQSHTAPSEG